MSEDNLRRLFDNNIILSNMEITNYERLNDNVANSNVTNTSSDEVNVLNDSNSNVTDISPDEIKVPSYLLPTAIPSFGSTASNSTDSLTLQTKAMPDLYSNIPTEITSTVMPDQHSSSSNLSESNSNIIGQYFRDDEDCLIYKVLKTFKYKVVMQLQEQ